MHRRILEKTQTAQIIIVGGGLAGLSAGIYLGRARRDTLIIDSDKSMARWEPDVQNYLGFPEGISGTELIRRARRQARRYGVNFAKDEIISARKLKEGFQLTGKKGRYRCERLLLATGIFHIPPDIPGVKPCLGHSMFFCKDCDGYRVQHKSVAVYGWTNEAVDYALGMLDYTSCVLIVTDGRPPHWDKTRKRWLREYKIPVYTQTICGVRHKNSQLQSLTLNDKTEVAVEALFTTRGDVYFNQLAKKIGAEVDEEGQIVVDVCMRTTVKGFYAAGCVTPANCQMIIAAGQGATAAQTINRELLANSLATHTLREMRGRQLRNQKTRPRCG
jgi:thioredoxin reductase (NADPH)